MVAALERIGAGRAARLIRDINAFLPDGTPLAENEERWKQIACLPPRPGAGPGSRGDLGRVDARSAAKAPARSAP